MVAYCGDEALGQFMGVKPGKWGKLDCRALGLSVDALDDLIVKDAKLWLDSGRIFGAPGAGYQRVNVACTRAYLEKGLRQLRAAVLARR